MEQLVNIISQKRTNLRWVEFGLLAKTMIANKINMYIEDTTKLRRHRGENMSEPVTIDTFALFPTSWLWDDGYSLELTEYKDCWLAVQNMLNSEFSQYKLTFSKDPSQEFIIPGRDMVISKSIAYFWVKIERGQPQVPTLGRSVYISDGTLSKEEMEDRAIGVLLGQAIGDALGARYEFTTSATAAQAVERDKVNGHLPLLGGGPFRLISGQITDDTELALAGARSIATYLPTCGLSTTIQHTAKSYLRWYLSDPFDIGRAIRTAFSGISPIASPQEICTKMLQNAQKSMESLSNGCLMKISPIALIGVLPAEDHQVWTNSEISEFAGELCKLTNPNIIAIDAVKVYVGSIRLAIHGQPRDRIWKHAVLMARTDTIKNAIQNAAKGVPERVDGQDQGYLCIALQLAYYELLHGNTFEESLTRTVARGGDTDTNGCIVGALLGALYGYSQIPKDWCERVLGVKNPRVRDFPDAATSDLIMLALTLGYIQE